MKACPLKSLQSTASGCFSPSVQCTLGSYKPKRKSSYPFSVRTFHSSFCNAKPVKQGEKRESQAIIILASCFYSLASIRAKRKAASQSVSLPAIHYSLLAISFYILPLSPLRPRTRKGQGFCRQRACRLWQSGRSLPRCFQGVWSIRGSRAPPMCPHQRWGLWY